MQWRKTMRNPYFNLIKHVWTYGNNLHGIIIGYYIAFIFAQGILSMTPYAFGRAIGVLQGFTAERLGEVIYWLTLSVVFLLGFWVLHGPARVIERHVALKIQQKFRLTFYEGLTKLPLKWHQDHHSGNTITRINRASVSLLHFAENQFIYIESIIRFVVSMAFLFWINVTVGGIALLVACIIMIFLLKFDKVLIPLYESENEVENRVGAVLFDYISNMTTVLTLRLGERTQSNLLKRIMSIWPIFKKEARLNEIKWFLMMFTLGVTHVLILVGYILYSLQTTGTIMIGLVVMIARYLWDLNTVYQDLTLHYGEIVRMETDVNGVKPIKSDIDTFSHLPKGNHEARLWHSIQIKNMSFHHSPGEVRGRVFHNVSFHMNRGEKIALIGASGAGKSTLLNLLCGLYTSDQVELIIDGTGFDSLEPLQAITTLIPQEPEIFENTIAFNITMDLPIDEQQRDHIINLSGFASVLESLPNGLSTDIREKGVNLSVGQKQRLALARGLFAARESSLILMDEPTSSLDLPTEQEILSNVLNEFENSTLIVSLHRLHLLPYFDRVIMLQRGHVIASGKVDNLLSEEGPVRDLWIRYKSEKEG
jgi:ATP-binding cassette, subfamily B, bacterial